MMAAGAVQCLPLLIRLSHTQGQECELVYSGVDSTAKLTQLQPGAMYVFQVSYGQQKPLHQHGLTK